MTMSLKKILGVGALLTTGILLANAFWIERYFIRVKEYRINSAKKNVWDIKVVQLSDLHLRSINRPLQQLAKMLNELQPDLILITGDTIDDAEYTSVLEDFLKLLDKNIEKAAVLGNGEYTGKVNLGLLESIYEGYNTRLLINETKRYLFRGQSISITGTDDFIKGKPDFEAAIKEYQESDYHIVLSHCPEYRDHISRHMDNVKVDLVLSGHTHGGQINIMGHIPTLPDGSGSYLNGWYKEKFPHLYVSKGLGTSIFPVRFGARAEMAVFYLAK